MAYTLYCHAVGLRDLGPTMSPMNAFLSLTGAETLPLRMKKHADIVLASFKMMVSLRDKRPASSGRER